MIENQVDQQQSVTNDASQANPDESAEKVLSPVIDTRHYDKKIGIGLSVLAGASALAISVTKKNSFIKGSIIFLASTFIGAGVGYALGHYLDHKHDKDAEKEEGEASKEVSAEETIILDEEQTDKNTQA